MPIYEDTLSYTDMLKLARAHHCAECGGALNIAWSAEKDCFMLRCLDLTHNTITNYRAPSPEEIEGRKIFNGGNTYMETTALQKLDPKQMLERVNQARFPRDLTAVDRQLIAQVSIEYGLDPLFGELMVYQGRPYITIDARRRKAQETGNLNGISARPATKQEKAARGVPAEDYIFVAEVWVKGASHPFEGWGRVTTKEIADMIAAAKSHGMREDALPIVKDPAAMAEKRAEAQALRRAFHIPLPSFEEIAEGAFEELPTEKKAPQSKTSPANTPTGSKASTSAKLISDAQLKKIWADAAKMSYTIGEVHAIVKATWGVESINDLEVAQASALIDIIAKGEKAPETEEERAQEDIDELWPK